MNIDQDKEFADLHVHTTFSDGMFTPEEVVANALRVGLKAVAITDHDCVDGISPATIAARGKDLEIIPGIEFSADIDESEIHILGYFLDHRNVELIAKLKSMRLDRVQRMRKMLALLNSAGFDMSESDVLGPVVHGTVGRLHLANVMKSKGFVNTVKEAFEKYIGDHGPCYVKHMRFDFEDAIALIKTAGGVSVLGHPGVSNADKYIPRLVEAGIGGIEVYHSEHTPGHNRRYLDIAKQHALLIAGGSDCHGPKKDKILMGTVKVSKEVVEALRREAREKR